MLFSSHKRYHKDETVMSLKSVGFLSAFLFFFLAVSDLSWSKERADRTDQSLWEQKAPIIPVLTPSRFPKTVPVLSERSHIGKGFRKLFDVLESGGSIDSVLDQSQWPKNDLLSSYLALELLLHPRYRTTTERLRHFIEKWPTHPQADLLRRRVERRLTRDGKDAEALSWYEKNNPQTEGARIRFLQLLLGKKPSKNALLIWKALYRKGVLFSKKIQNKTQFFKKQLTSSDHEARARALLKKGPYSGPKSRGKKPLQEKLRTAFQSVLLQLPSARQAYYRVLEEAQRGGERFHEWRKKLAPEAASDTELWDAWAGGLYRKGDRQGAIAFVLGKDSARMSVKGRRLLRFKIGRQFYVKRNFPMAMKLLGANVLDAGGKLQDSLWLAARSAHLHGHRKKALQWFAQLAREAITELFRAKGAFWAATLSRSSQEKAKWLEVAARYPGTFYGLLAEEMRGRTLVPLGAEQTCASFWGDTLREKGIRDLELLKFVGRSHYVGPEIRKLADQHMLSQNDQLCLAQMLGAPDLAIQVASHLRKDQGQTFWQGLYPMPDWTPMHGWKLDPALVWAASRQESLFSYQAESSVKALGLMQLMPATARQEAKRIGLQPSNRYWLKQPAYNLALGQSYLARMLRRFDGDLVLAVASYNAGPGRGDTWKQRRGKESPVTFIENIPFTETRNYVKRVIHGLAVYRLQLYGSASIRALIQPGKQELSDFMAGTQKEAGKRKETLCTPAHSNC